MKNSRVLFSPVHKRFSFLLSLLLLFFALSANAASTTIGFYCITNNSPTNCAIGEAQLTVTVSDPAAGQVLFHFKNLAGGSASSITDVYFDDGTLLGIASLTNGPGVSFAQDASPPDLPGGNSISPPFQVTAGFLADSNPPAQPNGVNPGEWLKVFFNLQSGGTYNDVISELADGRLRIGIHVQGFANGGSESFVNTPVPVPAAVWLFGSGLLGLAGIARRKKIKPM